MLAKGINLYENNNDDSERKRKKAASIHCDNNNSKYEMNHINNNNNNNNNEPEYEMSKVHQESDLHKLGECHCRHISWMSAVNIIEKHVLTVVLERAAVNF